ncbi:hypothetical protein MMC19_004695 [Ptychographa xylographoides]|nr:hypothetical protein [Ptychographa xylographoides]
MPTGNGENGDAIAFSIPTYMAIAAFTAVAWFNVLELNVQVFMTFKRHRGLYFWSLIISSYGCVLHALGFLLKFFQLTSQNYLSVTIITIGWYAMVTGQATVLYSRLHLVVREHKVLRGVLIMIIVDAICFHIPTTVLTYGSNSNSDSDGPSTWVSVFNVMERIQMTAFSIQEFVISGIYVYSTIKLLRPVYHGRTRRVMMQLIWINLIIIGMDVVLLTFEYINDYEVEATLKAMVYSIKLKLEFAVLNQLMTLANASVHSAQNLTYDDPANYKKNLKTKPRPKSPTYMSNLSKYVRKSVPTWAPNPVHEQKPKPRARHERSNSVTTQNTTSSYGNRAIGDHKWIPNLDRNCRVETQHVENSADSPSVFTHPAACFNPSSPKLFSSQDLLPPDSPTLSGSTLSQGSHSLHSGGRSRRPPRLDLSSPLSPLAAGGVLRSSRPSVTDWASGPDTESNASPSSSEVRLDPFEKATLGLHQSQSVRQANSAETRMGLDFMTSAL